MANAKRTVLRWFPIPGMVGSWPPWVTCWFWMEIEDWTKCALSYLIATVSDVVRTHFFFLTFQFINNWDGSFYGFKQSSYYFRFLALRFCAVLMVELNLGRCRLLSILMANPLTTWQISLFNYKNAIYMCFIVFFWYYPNVCNVACTYRIDILTVYKLKECSWDGCSSRSVRPQIMSYLSCRLLFQPYVNQNDQWTNKNAKANTCSQAVIIQRK